jgi:hypothetical protein
MKDRPFVKRCYFRLGSWLCESAKTLNRDRRSYSSKTVLIAECASGFNLEIELRFAPQSGLSDYPSRISRRFSDEAESSLKIKYSVADSRCPTFGWAIFAVSDAARFS